MKPNQELIALEPNLHLAARKLTGNSFDADDLVQDTMIRCMAKMHQFKQGTNIKAWVKTVMYSLFISEYRRKQRKAKRWEGLYQKKKKDYVVHDKQPGFNEINPRLQFAIDSIRPEWKVILLKAVVEEYSYREIAEELNIPIGTVMSRLSRSKSRIREVLASVN